MSNPMTSSNACSDSVRRVTNSWQLGRARPGAQAPTPCRRASFVRVAGGPAWVFLLQSCENLGVVLNRPAHQSTVPQVNAFVTADYLLEAGEEFPEALIDLFVSSNTARTVGLDLHPGWSRKEVIAKMKSLALWIKDA